MGEGNLPERSMRASDADRDDVAARLRDALADGRLDQDEHEERLGRVYAAKTFGELEPIVADLPAAANAPERRRSGVAEPAYTGTPTVVGVMADNALVADGTVTGRLNAYAWWGHATIDLTRADVPPEGVDVTAVAVMGGIDVHVPAGCRLTVMGIPVMGGVRRPHRSGPADGPVVRVRAVAFWGGVNVWYDDEDERPEIGCG